MRYRNHIPHTLLIVGCLLILALATSAGAETVERTGGEFRVGVGAAPVQTLFELFTDITMAAVSLGTLDPSTESEHPTVFAEYVKPMGERSCLIVHFNIASYEKEYLIESTGQLAGKVSDDFYTLMLGAKHYYVRSGNFGLYLDAWRASRCCARRRTLTRWRRTTASCSPTSSRPWACDSAERRPWIWLWDWATRVS